MTQQSLIVAISGASGAIYGIRLLEELKARTIPTHLIITPNAGITITHETPYTLAQVEALATEVHSVKNMAACISSGSHQSLGMVIAPCSMRSLAEIATGCTTTLVSRAADVTLKERRRLVLLVRESPLNLSHIRNMASVAEMGGIIAPPMPAFYNKPQSLADIVNHTIGRTLDLLGFDNTLVSRWQGLGNTL